MRYWLPTLLLLAFWLARITGLEALPLHNDEGLHLFRAVEVWNLHPFWEIRDGKIINHWAIAVFYPQNAPVFTGRIPTVFIAMIGLAAGYALLRREFGRTAAAIGCALWIGSPYLFFYERMAFSDAQAGALAVVALWLSLRLTRSGARADAVRTGLALAAAALFKFTAIPFALSIAVLVLAFGRSPLRARFSQLIILAFVVAACFALPIVYLLLRDSDLFAIALGWIGGGSDGASLGIGANLERLWGQLTGFGTLIWSVALIMGLALLPIGRPRRGGVLLIATALPLVSMTVLAREIQSRHFVAALPAILIAGGAGLGVALDALVKNRRVVQLASVGIAALLALGMIPFALTAYAVPADLPLPPLMRTQYIAEHPAGYGLREAVLYFPETIEHPELPIIGSMFPDGCRRANFYAIDGLDMQCADAPGLPLIEAALRDSGGAYVLVDSAPLIGADIPVLAANLNAAATRIAAYPRPGETVETASVVLWRLDSAHP